MELDVNVMEGKIEAILFSMGEAVEREQIAKALEIQVDEVVRIIHGMMEKYNQEDRGIQIIELENAFQMCTNPNYYDTLIKIVNIPKKHTLTDALLETLSIIAYKQPITRQEIEAIRGVSCVHAVNKLVEYKLIQEVGRLDAIGKPILFGTTEEFLRCFGIESIAELPEFEERSADEVELEKMRELAESAESAENDENAEVVANDTEDGALRDEATVDV